MNTIMQYTTFDKAAATHFGLEPTTGKWCVPDYCTDPDVRDSFFKRLRAMTHAGQRWAITEVIAGLPPDTLTRLRFDVDAHLDTPDPAAMDKHVVPFINTLFDVLGTWANVPADAQLRTIVLEKPAPSKADTDYKHGFKVMMPDLVATHAQMRQLRVLLNDRFEEWGDAVMLKGKTPELANVLDRVVYNKNGWLIYGSQKDDQQAGPYRATRMWVGGHDAAADLADMSFSELQQALSIFPHADPAAPQDSDYKVLQWTVAPPADPLATAPRATATATAGGGGGGGGNGGGGGAVPSAELRELLVNIVSKRFGDDTSTLDMHSRKARDAFHISYRFSRRGVTTCPHGQAHLSNGFYLQLSHGAPTPCVSYICLANDCPRTPFDARSTPCARRWAALEGVGHGVKRPHEAVDDDCGYESDVEADGDSIVWGALGHEAHPAVHRTGEPRLVVARAQRVGHLPHVIEL